MLRSFSWTKCSYPCEVTKYHITRFAKMPTKHYALLDSVLHQNNSGRSPSVLMFKHSKMTKIIQHEEIMEYDGTHLISDVGGIVGVFVGISFWNIYLNCLSPLLQKLQKVNQN